VGDGDQADCRGGGAGVGGGHEADQRHGDGVGRVGDGGAGD